MKRLLFICTVFICSCFCTQPVQAQASIKKWIKTVCQRCKKETPAAHTNFQSLLVRRAYTARVKNIPVYTIPVPLEVKNPARPLKLSSLENATAYYAYVRNLPSFPLLAQETEIYRGMTLDSSGQELRHILKNGLEVSKTHSLNFSAYDGKQYPDYQKAIYATPQLPLALTFALNDVRFDKHIPVIIHLKRVSDNRITSIPHDVPVSWIRRVSALLTINGYTLWGEIRLTQDDKFLFIPYLPRAAAQEELGK